MLTFSIYSCTMKNEIPKEENRWEDILNERLPYLGHRNWIVIADMAYPLQTSDGITTIWADEPYPDVLKKVKDMIDEAPHIFAHIYRDKELSFIPEQDAPGITLLRRQMQQVCGDEVQCVAHEELIARLDEAGRLFNIILIKTPVLIPYTTTFFELDCKYWDARRATQLDERMRQEQTQDSVFRERTEQ
mgnify:CR=1 FL=1